MPESRGESGWEVEVKLRLEGASDGVERLERAGFKVLRSRVFESNTVYDTASADLRRTDRLLRIRTSGELTLLTYKGPSAAARHKTREEIETALPDPRTLPAILDRLGYQPAFRYEKYRTEFARADEPGHAVLDETPIGAFLELEGTPEWIDQTARHLGFSPEHYITATYAELFFDAPNRTPGSHMIFEEQEKT